MKPPFSRSELFKARLQAAYKDQMPGGAGDDKTPADFDEEVLEDGAEHEMEHTYDAELAQEIAIDHLTEDPEYYEKLKRFGIESSFYKEVSAAHADFFVRALARIVGNKRYIKDIEAMFERIELEPEELQSLSLLAKDLVAGTIDNKDSSKYWKGGF